MSPAKKLALVKNSPARASAPKPESSEPLTILDSKFRWTHGIQNPKTQETPIRKITPA